MRSPPLRGAPRLSSGHRACHMLSLKLSGMSNSSKTISAAMLGFCIPYDVVLGGLWVCSDRKRGRPIS